MVEIDGILEENAWLGLPTATDMVHVVVGHGLHPQVDAYNCFKVHTATTVAGRNVLPRVELYLIRPMTEVGIVSDLSFQVAEIQYGSLRGNAQTAYITHTLMELNVHFSRLNLPQGTSILQLTTGLVSFLTDGPTLGY
jgi:hypothetical protein